MEYIDEEILCETENYQSELVESKKYTLNYKEDIYSLLIERYSDDNIGFKISQSYNISLYYYKNKYNYTEITKLFLLQKEYYQDLSKVFKFFDAALTKKKIKLEYNENKKTMELILNKTLDFDEIECRLALNKNRIENDDIFNMLINEINEIKNKKTDNKETKDNNIINELINKNKEYENKIKFLEDKIKILENEINQFKEILNSFNETSKINKAKNENGFIENPQNLKNSLQIIFQILVV